MVGESRSISGAAIYGFALGLPGIMSALVTSRAGLAGFAAVAVVFLGAAALIICLPSSSRTRGIARILAGSLVLAAALSLQYLTIPIWQQVIVMVVTVGAAGTFEYGLLRLKPGFDR